MTVMTMTMTMMMRMRIRMMAMTMTMTAVHVRGPSPAQRRLALGWGGVRCRPASSFQTVFLTTTTMTAWRRALERSPRCPAGWLVFWWLGRFVFWVVAGSARSGWLWLGGWLLVADGGVMGCRCGRAVR